MGKRGFEKYRAPGRGTRSFKFVRLREQTEPGCDT
jgi:hypothetical protein